MLKSQLSDFFPQNLPLNATTGVRWLVGWFWLNGPLRQYFCLYRAVSQREEGGGRKEE